MAAIPRNKPSFTPSVVSCATLRTETSPLSSIGSAFPLIREKIALPSRDSSTSTSTVVRSGSRSRIPAGSVSTSIDTRYTPGPGTGASKTPSESVWPAPTSDPSTAATEMTTPSTGVRCPCSSW